MDEQRYLDELARRIAAALPVKAVAPIGSWSRGEYVPGRSDLDVVAVAAAPVTDAQRDQIVATCSHEVLPCPATKLELVVYEPDGATVALNLNTGRDGTTVDRGEEWFWFVIDRWLSAEQVRALAKPRKEEVARAKAELRERYPEEAR
jgi:hypothetical protein